MAKTDMLCPFSGRLCEECSLYRGRHYYMCYCEKYRGRLDKTGQKKTSTWEPGSEEKIEIPLVKPKNAIDPFIIIMQELAALENRAKED